LVVPAVVRACLLCLPLVAGQAAYAAKVTDATAMATRPRVRARLVSPADVVVDWKDARGAAAGYVVEYVNQPTDQWVILGFFPPAEKTFKHARLAPGTPYQYRVRAFFGPVSPTVAVTVAEGLSDKAYAESYALPEDYSWAPPRTIAPAGGAIHEKRSIRSPITAASAAPTELRAETITSTASGFKLTWSDRSSDEEGFLLERVDDPLSFVVCAALGPDVNSFGWALEPPARKGSFRLRAYYFGPASNIAGITTAREPSAAGSPVRAPAMRQKNGNAWRHRS
jgi:hypothetical protein